MTKNLRFVYFGPHNLYFNLFFFLSLNIKSFINLNNLIFKTKTSINKNKIILYKKTKKKYKTQLSVNNTLKNEMKIKIIFFKKKSQPAK